MTFAATPKILTSKTFDIYADLTLIKSKKGKDKEKFSTPYTLLDLDYDVDPPSLFVFGKYINKKQVYVKLKIKGDQKRRVLCTSFHYAEEKMLFPYT